MVNCSCIVVALIAICLITVDVAHGRLGLGREKLLQVSPNQSNQMHHNVEKLTETFVMNSWCCWNSACWCSRSSCRESSASASRLLLQRKTLKIVLMAPADLYIRGRAGGGYKWVIGASLFSCKKRRAEPCGLWSSSAIGPHREQTSCSLTARYQLFLCDMKQPNFFIVFVVSHPGSSSATLARSLFHMHTSLYHYKPLSVVGFGYCVCRALKNGTKVGNEKNAALFSTV